APEAWHPRSSYPPAHRARRDQSHPARPDGLTRASGYHRRPGCFLEFDLMRYFVTGTGTEVGKTVVTRALTLALTRRGESIAALKPIEPDCNPTPVDAAALAQASGEPQLASAAGFYRAKRPVAPYTATLAGEESPPSVEALAESIRKAS